MMETRKVRCKKRTVCSVKSTCHWAKPHKHRLDWYPIRRSCNLYIPEEIKDPPKHKVTPTVCHDGKRHRWKDIASDTIGFDDYYAVEHHWCEQCGSITEFGVTVASGRRERCREKNGEYYIVTPKAMGGAGFPKPVKEDPEELEELAN